MAVEKPVYGEAWLWRSLAMEKLVYREVLLWRSLAVRSLAVEKLGCGEAWL